jgi:hypothetical protein
MGRRQPPQLSAGPYEAPRAGTWATPTGAPCPRCVRTDGAVEGTADCHGCGFCLLIAERPWA